MRTLNVCDIIAPVPIPAPGPARASGSAFALVNVPSLALDPVGSLAMNVIHRVTSNATRF